MAYEMNKWTTTTLETLKFIKEKNDQGIHPSTKELINGTMINWAYVLKKAGYLQNSDGFFLTDTGIKLLEELSLNPPQERRGKRKKHKLSLQKDDNKSSGQNLYRVRVEGIDVFFETAIDKEKAMQVLSFIANVNKK